MKRKILFCFIFFSSVIFPVFSQTCRLLIDGQQAFPQIIECIQNAENSIFVNMFIWRDDTMGNTIASELVDAADRGVQVTISKDSYGSVCEHVEECGKSFFHKDISFVEQVKISTLKTMYKLPVEAGAKDSESELYKRFMNHPNITVDANTFKEDHSKFYIFDNQILILGGINIEDKENGADMSDRVYQDYMIMLESTEYVELFNQIRNNGIEGLTTEDYAIYFGINHKLDKKNRIFEMEQMYLDMINSCQTDLTIVMSYFSPLDNFVDGIVAAAERGVNVTLVIPEKANFQDNSNKKTAKKLMKKTKGEIRIFYSPKMLHTKMVATEDLISFGSCNITKKAFKQLDELNVFITDESEIYDQIMNNVEKTINESTLILDIDEIKYNGFIAFLEGFLV